MNSVCKDHQQQIESINEQGKPMCRICHQQVNEIVQEYQGKKKSLLQKNEVDTLEKLRQAKKKMLEVQENLQISMNSHIETVTKKREQLLSYFAEQQRKVEDYQDQEQNFVKFKQNGNSFTKDDTTLHQIQEEKKNILELEKAFQAMLQKAINDYQFSTGLQQQNLQQNQQQNQQQIQLQEVRQKIQYQIFASIMDKSNVDFITINKDNNIIAYSESFEIHFLKIQDHTLQKMKQNIEDDDMELMTCVKFAKTSDDIYYGTDNGKDGKNKKQIKTHNGKGIVDLTLSDDDSKLFCAGDDKTIEIYLKKQNYDLEKVSTIENKEFGQMSSIAFNPISSELISSSFSKVQIWNISDDNQGQSKQIIEGLEPDKNNKVYFIDHEIFFVTSSNQIYFFKKNEEQAYVKVEASTFLENQIYQLPICYDTDIKILLIQKKESKEIDVMRFNQNEKKFVHQMSIAGEYNKLGIGQNGEYILLYNKADVNLLTVMKLE
ncbi:unnamed protein product (macronuclear) [Paramecium tetraurelia]|uniref:Anaphase-promoting complex subunit 4 WD40 domain-containing protein n=1 Tax=Paramecium tetraurelia TaxID=5888 RepID=A0E0K2_PARTE|nr:uncharacterized protein GSPATT00021987001 [Paramecium tetraurelia]CAK88819.1 unnamed protein product [Paramecium tetraurelia]|eukprot:XP_001456216.1 hypothetical protein (macronuclear) [Paramecium tetraurelia strain d4-2]